MKPNFALTLSFEGIGLLHRAFPGWHLVGEVALDSADLTGELRALRAKAATLDPSGLRCKLVVPNDQIRYLSIPDETDGDTDARVRAALNGATPYAVDDLVYDWSRTDAGIGIAAVARETLEEAEAFATEHQFAPLSFVAIPAAGDFRGEPWFGPTAQAEHLLSDGQEIIRDTAPIRIIGASKLPEPDETPAAPGPDPVVPPEAPVASGTAEETTTAEPPSQPDESGATGAADPEAAEGSGTTDGDDRPPRATGAAAPQVTGEPTPAPPAFSSIRASRSGDLPASAPRLDSATRLKGLHLPAPDGDSGNDTDPPAPQRLRAAPADPLPDHAARTGASLRPAPAPEADEAGAARRAPTFFSKRRSSAPATAVKAAATQDARARREDERQRMTIFGARETSPVGGKPRFLGLILMALLVLFLVGVAAWASVFLDDGLSRFFGTPEKIRVTDVPAIAEPEQDRETVTAPQPSAVAVTEEEPDTLPVPSDPDPAAAETQAEEMAAADGSAAAPQPAVGAATDEAPGDSGLSGATALSSYAASGIWQMAPEPPSVPSGPSDVGNLFQASLDSEVTIENAATLPKISATPGDQRLPTPLNPPAFDTRFLLDSRGLVKPTEDGALTPDGIPVYAGAPPIVPPATPPRAAVTPDNPELAAEVPRLAALRPKARPALPDAAPDATPDTAADAAETPPPETTAEAEVEAEAEATPLETAALESTPAAPGLRPRLRPENLVPTSLLPGATAATEADGTVAVDADAVSAAIAEAATEVDPGNFENPTAQAVTASLIPRQRPKDFAAVVQEARSVSPEEDVDDGEPEISVASVSPSLPSNASVAREATEQNAINLREVNLIGVYGAPNSRRALVRLSNGRYKKVKVGDKLDGGQVAAIGDSELRYVKRGKAVLLRMPKG